MKQCRYIFVIVDKFVVSGLEPFRYLLSVFNHSVYMKVQCFLCHFLKFGKCVRCKDHSSGYIVAKRTSKIIATPCNIYYYLFHIDNVFSLFVFLYNSKYLFDCIKMLFPSGLVPNTV